MLVVVLRSGMVVLSNTVVVLKMETLVAVSLLIGFVVE